MRKLELLKRRADAELASADKALAVAKTDDAKARAADRKQKAAAKALIKLHFTPSTAAQLARETNVDPAILASVASKLSSATPLTLEESDVYGRFDLAIAAMLDYAYQRGDQFYRNSCKTLAAVFAVALAVAGNQELTTPLPNWQAVLIGIVATPLAPIAKDVSSAIAAAARALSSVRR